MRLYISKKPSEKGGGSNTFAYNFISWAKRNKHRIVSKIQDAEKAIIIANFGEIKDVQEAKKRGCYIIHRIDEYFSENEDEYRAQKHRKIFELNQYADVTVFQSQFTYHNAYPFLQHHRSDVIRYGIIYNGTDPHMFYPGEQMGKYIGHVTWGIGVKQRLDILHRQILDMPQETFMLIGRHKESEYDFRLPNVTLKGPTKICKMPAEYRKMKVLFYPSQNDPCSNTIIEAILSGVTVCYNEPGGASEIVKDCGEPLERFDYLLSHIEEYRQRCLRRKDLYIDDVMNRYLTV